MLNEIITHDEIKRALVGIKRPFFAHWIYFAKNKNRLDLIVEGLLQSNLINKPIDAIKYLSKLIPDEVLKNTKKVNYTDFQRAVTSRHLAKKLTEKIRQGSSIYEFRDKTTRYGVFGHTMAAQLFSGALTLAKTKQLGIFPEEQRPSHKKRKQPIAKKRTGTGLSKKFIEKIEKMHVGLLEIMSKGHAPTQTDEYRELLKYLDLVYDEHLAKVQGPEIYDAEDQYLSFLTVMTWVQVLLYYEKVGPGPLFSEIPVLKNSEDVGGGRLDILSVLSINGKAPVNGQIQKINNLTKKAEMFPSGGHVIRALSQQFGDYLHLLVTDWKFMVGDGVNGFKKKVNIIDKKDVEDKPLKKHENQIKRYLTFLVVSHSLAAGYSKLDETEMLWETGRLKLTGRLVYLFHDREPIIHEISLTTEEIKSVFQDQIVSSFSSAKVKSSFRVATNLAMEHVYRLLKVDLTKPVFVDNSLKLPFLEESTASKTNIPTISELIMERYEPVFMDPETRFIEIVGYKGEGEKKRPITEVHLDTVLKAGEQGIIDIVKTSTGIKICCPVHGEKTPSYFIDYGIGRGTCFGCDLRGAINIASIPNDIDVGTMRTVRWELEGLVIPPRHREIMECAQKILQSCFWGSRGEMYLHMDRKLNPRTSFYIMSAGFADERLIVGLLREGFSLEELHLYGFIDYAVGISPHSRTVKIFEKAGHSIENQKRLLDAKENKWGLPYSILEDKVTYPLEVHKVINSFYGRSVLPECPKHLRHRKIRAKETGMRHGGVNISWAVGSACSHAMIVEAPINMATLMETAVDLKCLTAIVGVNNPLLVEFLAQFKGDIILGFDFDPPKWIESKGNKKAHWGGETGQKNTVLFRDRIVEDYGFKGKVYDFTGGFVKNNPGIIYNDPNQYWVEQRKKISIFDNLQEIPEKYVHSMERE